MLHLAGKGAVSRKSISSVAALIRHSPPVHVPPWLKGWKYRKSHEIIGSTAEAVTDYQVRIRAYYGTPWDYQLFDGGYKYLPFPQLPKMIYDAGNLILPYQASDGNVRVKIIDASTLTETADYVIGADPLPGDGHACPAIIKFGSYYVVLYGSHAFTGTLTVSYSTDLQNWTTYNFPLSGNFSYPQLFLWTDGNLYMFIRHSVSATQTVWRLYKCTDITNSATWSLIDTIIDEGDGYAPYAKIRVEDGRAIVAWGRYIYATSADDTKLMCAYSDDLSTWYDTDGNAVTLPLSAANCLLYTHTSAVRTARARAVGDTFYILTASTTSNPQVLVEKTIGVALNTYSVPRNYRRPTGLFYHTAGYLRFYITSGTNLYRYRFDLSTKTFVLEQSVYPTPVYAVVEGGEIYDLPDWIVTSYLKTSDESANAHDILIATDREKTLPNDEVSLGGKCRTDFGDVRFTDGKG